MTRIGDHTNLIHFNVFMLIIFFMILRAFFHSNFLSGLRWWNYNHAAIAVVTRLSQIRGFRDPHVTFYGGSGNDYLSTAL